MQLGVRYNLDHLPLKVLRGVVVVVVVGRVLIIVVIVDIVAGADMIAQEPLVNF